MSFISSLLAVSCNENEIKLVLKKKKKKKTGQPQMPLILSDPLGLSVRKKANWLTAQDITLQDRRPTNTVRQTAGRIMNKITVISQL